MKLKTGNPHTDARRMKRGKAHRETLPGGRFNKNKRRVPDNPDTGAASIRKHFPVAETQSNAENSNDGWEINSVRLAKPGQRKAVPKAEYLRRLRKKRERDEAKGLRWREATKQERAKGSKKWVKGASLYKMAHQTSGAPSKHDYTQFPEDEVQRLAEIHCTFQEIAHVLDWPYQRLVSHPSFLLSFQKGWEIGKASLRRLQWDCALTGNVVMLIWMGKQILGQRDVVTAEVGMIPHAQLSPRRDLSKLSPEKLKQLRDLLKEANAIPDTPDSYESAARALAPAQTVEVRAE
jgi:hypothetical protein